MDYSVIIATYDRDQSLRTLLSSIVEEFAVSGAQYEVIVANNAREAGAAQRISEAVEDSARSFNAPIRELREPQPGKCRAQNLAIRNSHGAVLVFFDDDVELAPDWFVVMDKFFKEGNYSIMQGPILIPPQMKDNQEFAEALDRFRTISYVKYRGRKEINTLTGANIAVRREVFDQIGYFNEALGPGMAGISEDVEFAKRYLAVGGRIGYEANAAVYHLVDWSRLTEEFFRMRHEQQGRSRLLYKRQSTAAILLNLVRALFQMGWYGMCGNVRKKYRAKGRYFHYRAMLLAKWSVAPSSPAPTNSPTH